MSDNIFLDPSQVSEMSKEELLEAFEQTKENVELLSAQRQEMQTILLTMIEGNGEVIGNHQVTKSRRLSYFPELKAKEKLQKAKEFGAVKEAIDNDKLKKMLEKGVEIPFSVTEYLIVKDISQKEV
jgi:regulator of replication initiation timing